MKRDKLSSHSDGTSKKTREKEHACVLLSPGPVSNLDDLDIDSLSDSMLLFQHFYSLFPSTDLSQVIMDCVKYAEKPLATNPMCSSYPSPLHSTKSLSYV